MSQENVDLNHQANDAFNRRDLHAFLALMDHDVEFIPYEVAVQGGDRIAATTASADGGRRLSRSSPISGWRPTRFETSETETSYRDAFPGMVPPAARLSSGRCGRWSNGATTRPSGGEFFESEAEALEAAGLRE